MAKTMIRVLGAEADYDAALEEIEHYFDEEPKPGTPEANRFDLLALVIEDYERKRHCEPKAKQSIVRVPRDGLLRPYRASQ